MTRYPYSERKIYKDSPWIHGWCDGTSVRDELSRRVRSMTVNNTAVGTMKESEVDIEKKACHQSQVAEALIIGGRVEEDAALVALLKACARQKDLYKGSRIHADILQSGVLKRNIAVGNTLVSMYAKCGALAKAQKVFDELPVHDVVSWTALIAGYCQYGHGEEALKCFDGMQNEGLSPNAVTFTCILKVCGSIGAAEKGKKIHAEIFREGLVMKDGVLGTALVDMYAKCGVLTKAQQVFDELPIRNVVSWNALIAGYVQHGCSEKAINTFKQMQCEGISPNAVTFTCLLKACGSTGAAEKGKEIHDEIVRGGLLQKDIVLATALVDMYAKCGALAKAQEVFDELPVRNVVSWNALIAGYTQHGYGKEALDCFRRMQHEGLSPNAATYACILKACGSIGVVDKGKEIHDQIVKDGLLGGDSVLGNALIDMYAKCGALVKTQQVFDRLSVRDVVTWNVLISGYCQYGHGTEALSCFEQMECEGFSPDRVTFACILKACGSIGAAGKGREIHAKIVKRGLLEKSSMLGTALVDMYAKCGALAKAQKVFDKLSVRNPASWTALIAGYSQHGYGEQALNCFECMQREGVSADSATFACILKSCGSVGAAEKGKEIHGVIAKEGLLDKHNLLGTALVDMYAKCGALAKAQEVFDELPIRDVVSWNALIAGYGHVGKHDTVFDLFKNMLEEGIEPNLVTFIVVLHACSYLGLVVEGQRYFRTMTTKYGISPTLEHYTCMVNLFGRAGHFDKALAMMKKMPSCDYLPSWCALLGACQKWGNVKLGILAFEHAIRLDEKSAVAYACMSNIYMAAGMQEDAKKIEAMRIENKAWKKPGRCWWTDVTGNVHSFCVGDRGHQNQNVYVKLEEIAHRLSQEGCISSLERGK